ncbi:monocarboxylate transporter 13-like [Branchiostoma floridae x Branchiostoma japonicum]
MFGSALSFGVFYAEFREVFQESAGITSFISSILVATMLMCSPFAGALSNLTSCRTAIIAGGVISAVGLGVSFFAQTMVHLFFSVGILTGLGLSLMYAPSLAMIGRYFDRRHATANGIAVCGLGVGQLALPPLFQFLIDEFGWRGALLIVAGLMLNGCVCGALMRPIHLAEDTKEQVDRKAQSSGDQELPIVHVPFRRKVNETFHVSLLKHRPFLVFSVSMFAMVLGNSVVFVHPVAHAQNLGVEKTSAAFLLSIMGVSEIFSRPLNGWLSDRGKISKIYYYMIGVTGMAIANLAIPFASNYTGLAACMVLYGLFSGIVFPLVAVLVCRYSGASRISSGLGWAFVFQGAAFLLGPPVAGWLYDATGNYDMSFFAAAIFIFVSVLVLLLNPCSTTSRTLGPGTGGLPDRPDGIVVLSHVKRDVSSEDGIMVHSHVKRDVSSEDGIVVLGHVKRDVSSEDGIVVLSHVKRDVSSEDGIVVLSHVKRDVSSEDGIVVLSHVKRDVSSEDGQSNPGFRG